MSTGGIFTAILAGIVIGALGRLIIPGRQAIGWILTFALGLVGAVVGGFLAEGMDVETWWVTLIFQVAVAGILVALVSFLIRGSVNKRADGARRSERTAPRWLRSERSERLETTGGRAASGASDQTRPGT